MKELPEDLQASLDAVNQIETETVDQILLKLIFQTQIAQIAMLGAILDKLREPGLRVFPAKDTEK